MSNPDIMIQKDKPQPAGINDKRVSSIPIIMTYMSFCRSPQDMENLNLVHSFSSMLRIPKTI